MNKRNRVNIHACACGDRIPVHVPVYKVDKDGHVRHIETQIIWL